MAKIPVLSWQEIPSAVIVKDADGTKKVQLSPRFMELIDMVAMRRGLDGSDDYLEHWHKVKRPSREGTAQDVVEAVAAELEANFETIKAEALGASS